MRAAHSPREGRWRGQGARRPEEGSSVLSRGASNRTGGVPAWWMELYPEITRHVAMAGRSQGCRLSAVKRGSSHLPEPSRPACGLPWGAFLKGSCPMG